MKTSAVHLIVPTLVGLSSLLFAACVEAPGGEASPLAGQDPAEERVAEASSALENPYAAAPLPSFAGAPNIGAAAAQYLSPDALVRAVLTTNSGFQVYQCAQASGQAPAWSLRTPLAHLYPLALLGYPLGGPARQLTSQYHYRSDFGGQLSQAELSALGLTNPPVNAPVWEISFRDTAGGEVIREVVAGRVLAQDTIGAGNIPDFFIEVRGRFATLTTTPANTVQIVPVDGLTHLIASSEYMLRWGSTGGVAPEPCTSAILGAEVRVPYTTAYYFIDNDPPPEINPSQQEICDLECEQYCGYDGGSCVEGVCQCWS